MMLLLVVSMIVAAAALAALTFSTLNHALRDFSRARLADALQRRGRMSYFGSIDDHVDDLLFVTALLRLLGNIVVLVAVLHALRGLDWPEWPQYLAAVGIAGSISLVFSVLLPQAMARNDGERAIAASVGVLSFLRIALRPLLGLTHVTEQAVSHLAPESEHSLQDDQVVEEIRSVVEEAAKEGTVDPQERKMFESVMHFTDMTAADAMTARTAIVAVAKASSLEQVVRSLQSSGHSRLPVHEGSLERIVGIVYARDLVGWVGRVPGSWDMSSVMRPAYFVPETKPLGAVLQDFRNQKMQIAIVLDEYGATAGLVTIKDVIEELVGEIKDEYERASPSLVRRIDAQSFEADARVRLDDFNRDAGTSIPEDSGYDTLGGYVTGVLGRIPSAGTTFVTDGVRFTVLDAEPQRVKRVGIKLIGRPAAGKTGGDGRR